ncbi:flagellar hook-associated protein FlgK [uncultured Desulfuromusa sp.]|uniref:flagellar hook-associated protein FlgK n=1 Tax=uncultured Desulfuromusa sp. TaxID=219183 RepID=UPI002AA62FEA|nr:flagellar hook-associated protein FlgK [uncultured Desulfuromusa sp.]
MGLMASLYAGRSGLFVNQKGIEVAGNNVANVNTPGYSKQSLRLGSLPTLEFNGQMIGQGAFVTSIDRNTNSFVLSQLNNKSAELGEMNAKSLPLTEIERIIGIGDSSLANDIVDFFDSWQKLSDNPSGNIERQQAMQSGTDIAKNLQGMVHDLSATIEGLNDDMSANIIDLNRKLQEIGDLNSKIVSSESTGISSNALRDQRDLLLQEVSETAGITYYEENNGMISVQLPNGTPLVTASEANTIKTSWVSGSLELSLTSGATTIPLNGNSFGGEIKGQLELRDEYIPQLVDQLDQLAYGLAEAINTVHNSGIDANGHPGGDYFTFSSGSPNPWSGAASTLTMALTDTSQIAAGSGASYLPGDNSNCLNISSLRDQTLINGSTFQEYYGVIAADVGLEVSQNNLAMTSANDAMLQIQNMRDETSGVSLDEEILMLTQYQTGYEAAAKYLSTIDEMLDTLLRM